MTDFSNHHVVISGGGSGVGAAVAAAFAEAGARVTIMGRRQDVLDETAESIGALAVSGDVTDRSSVDQGLAAARDGNGPVTIAVANAGVAVSMPFSSMEQAELLGMMNVNLIGTYNLWQACLADMQAANWGRLMAVASTAGLKGYSYVSGYCAAKHAVVGLTRSVAVEMASTGITANAICPGFVDTPMLDRSIENIVAKTAMTTSDARKSLLRTNPQGRFIEVDEVAASALWLASDGARSVNGQAISINGGEL